MRVGPCCDGPSTTTSRVTSVASARAAGSPASRTAGNGSASAAQGPWSRLRLEHLRSAPRRLPHVPAHSCEPCRPAPISRTGFPARTRQEVPARLARHRRPLARSGRSPSLATRRCRGQAGPAGDATTEQGRLRGPLPAARPQREDPQLRRSKVQVVYNFGREDHANREALQRLVASVTRFLEPEKALAAAAVGLEFTESRPLGGTWALDAL